MATPKQIEANRRNAQKSTGPTSDAGKQRSRMNALKHGLGSIHAPLGHEDPTEFHEMRAGVIETYQPANTQELQLVDAIASAWFRLQRAGRFEAGLIEAQLDTIKKRHGKKRASSDTDDRGVAVAMSDPENLQAWTLLARYDSRAQSAYYRAIEALRKVQAERRRKPAEELRAHQAELKAQQEHEAYLKRTTADPNWKPDMPLTPLAATKMGSFGETPHEHRSPHFPAQPEPIYSHEPHVSGSPEAA